MSDLSSIVEKNVKLAADVTSKVLPSNESPEYNKDVEGAYIREDEYLGKHLTAHYAKHMDGMAKAFADKNEGEFKEHHEKLSHIHSLCNSGKKEEVAKYLAEHNPEPPIESKVAELSASVASLTAKLEEMKNSKFFKFGADMKEPEEKAEKGIFDEMKSLIDKLEKTHGGK